MIQPSDRKIKLGRLLKQALRLAVPSTAVLLLGSLGSPLQAQIRTGRSERPLYQNELQNRKSESAPRSSVRPASGRMTPGRVVSADGRVTSILEGGQEPQSAAPPAAPRAEPAPRAVEPVAPVPLDDSEVIYDGDASYDYDGHTGGGGSCGCSSCSSAQYGHIAPGVMGGFGGHSGSNCDGSCGGHCGGGCCGPIGRLLGRLSIRAEVPQFWRRAQGIPALVTSAPTGTAANVAGQLGQSTTQNLLGPGILEDRSTTGVRISVGTWLDSAAYRGVLLRYANAGNQSDTFNFNSSQFPIIARPFTNISTGTAVQDTQLVAFPGTSTGNLTVNFESQVSAFDIALRRLAYRDRFTRVDWIAGYERNRIEETLAISSSTLVTGGTAPLLGSSIAVQDNFRTENEFQGGVLGVMSTRQFACWQFEAMFRMGLGNLNRKVIASGSTTTTSSSGAVATDPQGLLVRSTNSQGLNDNTFIVVPEVGFNAGYYITRNLDATIGYNYLMLPKVAQVGKQVDSTINLNDPLTGALRPQLTMNEQKYWLHSLNFGLQWKY